MHTADIATMNIGDVRRELVVTRTEKAKLAARELALVARMEALLKDPESSDFAIPEYELVAHAGMTSREAREVVHRSHLVEASPSMAAALASGLTTAAHVDVIGRGIKQVGAERDAFMAQIPDLTQAAADMTVAEFSDLVRRVVKSVRTDDGLSTFESQRRNTTLRTWTDDDGMFNLRGRFDPVSGAAIASSIERRKEQMFHSGTSTESVDVAPGIEPNDHLSALALVSLIGASSNGPEVSTHPRAEVVVHIDLESLVSGAHASTTSRTSIGTDVPIETIRRLACEAEIIPVVLDGRSVPIDVGRAKRLATSHQRRALEAVHQTCAIPDCVVPFHHCQIHHIEYWEHGGRTDLDNQVPLCSRHHHAAHEGGWTLKLEPRTRAVAFQPPIRDTSDYRCHRDARPRPLRSA